MVPSQNSARSTSAFSLPEVLIAIGLIAIALMALIGHSTLLMGAAQKNDDSSIAASVAKSHLDRVAQEVLLDHPAGQRQNIWQHDDPSVPFLTFQEKVGPTDYDVEVFVTDVVNSATGQKLGSGPSGTENTKTRLKQVVATVAWWDSKTTDRVGYGKLELRAARLVKVTHEDP